MVNQHVFAGSGPVFPEPQDISAGIETDKKGAEGGIHFVLTQGIGDAIVKKLTSSQILDAYERFIREYKKDIR